MAASFASLEVLALNGAKIFEDGRAVCVLPSASFRRLVIEASSCLSSRPRDILQDYNNCNMIDGDEDEYKVQT